MTPAEYKQARKALGLTIQQAGQWLGVSSTTAQRYAQTGLPGPAARAVGIALAILEVERYTEVVTATMFEGECTQEFFGMDIESDGIWVRHSDLTAAVGL